MKRSFEEFTGRGASVPSERPRITLQKNGKMSLNKAAVGSLKDPAAVILLYDRSGPTMGVRAAARRVPHAYPVSRHGRSAATVTIIAFAKHYGIDLFETRAYDAVIEGDVLVIDLSKGVPSGRGAPTKDV